MSKRINVKLSEVTDNFDYKRIPLSAAERSKIDAESKIYPYYGAQGIIDYVDNYLFDGEYLLVAEDGENLKSLKNNIATWAKGKFWVNNHAHILGEKKNFSLKYIYYLLNILNISNWITGSAQPKLNQENLGQINFDILENYDEQCKVANLLSTIDEKIDTNNKINEELEKLAKTLYDYWFVQFDFPDENKRPYKSSGGAMVYNEILKREIPANWKVENISKYCNIIDCLHSKKPDYCYEANNLYLLQLENLTNAGYIDITNRYYISKDDYKYWIQKIEIQENDFIFANAGRTGAFGKIPKDVRCALGRNLTAIRPISISPYYLRMYFGSNDMRQQVLSNLDCGAFFKSFNVKSIKLIALLIPQENILNNFILKISPIIKQIETNNIETQFLTEVRDFLLPMLMNGQATIRQ